MVITCIFTPISCIIFAILLETSPETPVSISSKIIVGNCIFSDNIFLIESIILDNSPPEATFFNSPKLPPLLAANKNDKLSFPFDKYSVEAFSSIEKRAFGIPNSANKNSNCFCNFGIALVRDFVIIAATSSSFLATSLISVCLASINVPASATWATFSDNDSCIFCNSLIESTECFFCKL